ncbi:MAG: hypothetical protein JSS02_12885 [Planctomycetes bacterium]|nr:hypothetical protein [Planctomycetota bacterium]
MRATLRLLVLAWLGFGSCVWAADQSFRIQVVDEATGRGVPLVELRTVHDIRYVTDSHGVVAFDEPGLMNRSVFFFVQSHGYEFPKDGFGFAGKALDVQPGGTATLKIRRINIAQRLYRITGAGIYRDTLLTGGQTPLQEPHLNGSVLGSDSVQEAVFAGKLYWFWGDTNRPRYPLGNFDVPGATSELPAAGGLDPDVGINLNYFLDQEGFARPTMKMPGSGPTWLDGLVVLRDHEGQERMFGWFQKIRPPLEVYQNGLAEFDLATSSFKKVAEFPRPANLYPTGHTLVHRDANTTFVYFCHPFPLIRVPADPERLSDLSTYEAYTCLQAGSDLRNPQFDRDANGRLQYSWKPNTAVVGPAEEKKLLASGKLRADELRFQLIDHASGKPVLAHHGSINWNEYRRKWVMITVEIGGTKSHLGEVWYAESAELLGPWRHAVKVVTHDKYSFYNPRQHPMFDQNGGRTIFFEGTYTQSFSGNTDKTPRYEYNQIMYRLDLDDPRLKLPQASESSTNAPAVP